MKLTQKQAFHILKYLEKEGWWFETPNELRCPKCGEEYYNTEKYCSKDGTKLVKQPSSVAQLVAAFDSLKD